MNKNRATAIIRCNGCEKVFKHKESLCRHRKTCTGVSTQDSVVKMLQDKIRNLEERLHTACSNSATVINNGGNQQNIFVQMNPFGHEDISKITSNKSFLDKCILRRDKGGIELIKQIHFDPVNQNVRLCNDPTKSNYCDVFTGRGWHEELKADVFEKMIDKIRHIFKTHWHENEDRIIKEKFVPEYRTECVDNYIRKLIKKDLESMVELASKIELSMTTWSSTARAIC